MSAIDCTACEALSQDAPVFVVNGVTDEVCTSLAADTGLNPSLSPKHNDAEDLHNVNDCLIGRMGEEVMAYDVCEWQDFMEKFIPNLYELEKAEICAMGGIWTYIHNLLSRVSALEDNYNTLNNTVNELLDAIGGSSNVVPVIRKYTYTVPAAKFIQTNHWDGLTQGGGNAVIGQWFSGAPDQGECYISIPTSEMESVIGVWAQSYVVPAGNPFDGVGRVAMQTVAIQTWQTQGNNTIVNFDTYELDYPTEPNRHGAPYPVTVDFLVVGTRTIT